MTGQTLDCGVALTDRLVAVDDQDLQGLDCAFRPLLPPRCHYGRTATDGVGVNPVQFGLTRLLCAPLSNSVLYPPQRDGECREK